jgi:uncharacterized protein
MRLLCLSDIHGEAAGLKDLLPLLASVDVVAIAGDVTHLGGSAEAREILAPLLSSTVRCLAVAGNMDRDGARAFLSEQGIDIHCGGVIVDGVGFQGLGGGTPSPFHSPWEIAPEAAERCLASGAAAIRGAGFKVLVSHAPPHGTRLDRTLTLLHAGSGPVRDFILSGTVGLCVCGHIHEASGEETLGGIPCLNVGPFKDGHYALVDIQAGRASIERRTL